MGCVKCGKELVEFCDACDVSVRIVALGRVPQAQSLEAALVFLEDVMRTLVAKEAGYGNIEQHVAVFAPDCTPEQRIRTRLDEKLTRLRRLGVVAGDDEDTIRDVVGYLALLAGLRDARAKQAKIESMLEALTP